MSVPVINAILESEESRIGHDIAQRTIGSSAWVDLMPVEEFPSELSETIRLLTWERGRALNEGKTAIQKQTWAPVTASNGEPGGACLPPTTRITVGTTLREYGLSQTAIESPDLCVTDMLSAFKRSVQLGKLKSLLADNTNQIIIERRRDVYRELAQHKVVVTMDGLVVDTVWTVPGSTPSKLTQGILDKFYSLLNRLGGPANPLERLEGAPYYGLICSMEQSESIKQETPHRDAMIRSPRVSELLRPLGVTFSFKGYTHIIDPLPPRYNIVTSAWVEISPWVPVEIEDSGHGYKLDPNPAYDTATWEESTVFVPKVASVMVPKTVTNPGADVTFDPVDYRGAWKWNNFRDREKNPDGTIGYFRGVYMDGAKPDMTELGVIFRHARCDLPLNLTGCGY